MSKRTFLTALVTAGVSLGGLGLAVSPATADQRTLLVTLLGGEQITVTVDVPPGTPVDQVAIPGVTTPIVSIQDITVPEPQTVPPAADPGAPVDPATLPPASGAQAPVTETPAAAPPATAPPAAEPPAHQDDAPELAPKQERQQTTGSAKADEQADDDADAAPTPGSPGYTLAIPGAAPIGVPNFFIDKFRIPPFLLPIYQAAGIEYGVRWEILAAINEIETDYGRNLNVSSAGAVGWMQFLPSTWEMYGVDANHDGRQDPYNPVDAIFAAARYLKAAGADTDIEKAIFAYNHADWYVDSVLLRARLIGGLPADLVGALTGLTQGRFPVYAKASYADGIEEEDAERRVQTRNAAVPVDGDANRRGINIYADAGSPVVAVQDGKIVRIGESKRLGRFVQLRDVYGNTYTYGHLKKVATSYPQPKPRAVSPSAVREELHLGARDPKPEGPASAGKQVDGAATKTAEAAVDPSPDADGDDAKQRLFANPSRPRAYASGGEEQILEQGLAPNGGATMDDYLEQVFGLEPSELRLRPMKVGAQVIAGTILGRIGSTDDATAPHVRFEVRPAGRGAPRVDPKPILDGWKLLESTAVYRAAGKNPFFGPDAENPSIGQILLMSKAALQHRVLTDPKIEIYDCGRRDIRAGIIDRRVLATLAFLSANGLEPTVSSLECGHSYLTKSGNVSEHSSGNAVDIAAINGIPIQGHQGEGSIADEAIRRLLTLQGTMKPHQIISLMTYDNTDNTLALPDHADHIHVGFQPLFGANAALGRQLNAILKPGQWTKLIDRLGEIENPAVRTKPSKYAIADDEPSAGAGD